MLQAFLTTLSEMLQIMLLLVLGYGLNKLHVISHAAENVLSRCVTTLFLPALMLYANMIECQLDSLLTYGSWVLWGALFFVVSLLLSLPLSRLFARDDPYQRGVYRYALTFPNTGAVGTPLILSLFGTAGMFQYSLYTFVGGLLTYSWGVANLQPSHGRTSLGGSLKKCINPVSLAILAGMLLGVLGAKHWMPTFVVDTVHSLGQCYVVVSLLLAGFSIADYPFDSLLKDRRIYLFSLYRLLIVPVVFLLMLYLVKAPLMIATMTAVSFASPCGMNVVVFPAAYGEDCRAGAGMVLVSNLGSIITVPLIYALTQTFFG